MFAKSSDKNWLVFVECVDPRDSFSVRRFAEIIAGYIAYATAFDGRILALRGNPGSDTRHEWYEFLFSFHSKRQQLAFLETIQQDEITRYDDIDGLRPTVPTADEIRDAKPYAMVLSAKPMAALCRKIVKVSRDMSVVFAGMPDQSELEAMNNQYKASVKPPVN